MSSNKTSSQSEQKRKQFTKKGSSRRNAWSPFEQNVKRTVRPSRFNNKHKQSQTNCMSLSDREVSGLLQNQGGIYMPFDAFSNTEGMNFGQHSANKTSQQNQIWNKVLQFVQGKNDQSNLFAKYVEMKKVKKEIELKFEKDPKLCQIVLKTRQLFIDYLHGTYILPHALMKGPSFKYDDKYKMYMKFINDKEFYVKLKSNYLAKEEEINQK